MDGGLVAQWAAVGVLALSQAVMYVRNNRYNSTKDTVERTEVKDKLETISKQLDDPENGLSAIKKSVDDQRLYCARVSTSLKGRIDNLEKA